MLSVTLYTVIDAVARKTAVVVRAATVASLIPHKDRVYTLTYDNENELAQHDEIAKELGAKIYFAHPALVMGARIEREHERLIRLAFECRTEYSSPGIHP